MAPPIAPAYQSAPSPAPYSGGMSAGPGPMGAVKKKYKVLRFIAVLIKIFAIVAGALLIIGGLVTIIGGLASSTRTTTTSPFPTDATGPMAFLGGAVFGFVMIIYGVFIAVFLYAYAEWMYVFMDIEENTRMTNEMLMSRK